jgi:hypothetical protein
VEDLVAIYVGPAAFKIGRLAIGVAVTVHLFACAYWRIKVGGGEEARDGIEKGLLREKDIYWARRDVAEVRGELIKVIS